MRHLFGFVGALALSFALMAGCGDASGAGGSAGDGGGGAATDPGTADWELVPRERMAEECGLDPALLEAADEALGFRWAVVRYGKLCHEYYPNGDDPPEELFSASKSLSALVVGIASYLTKDLPRTGPQSGPLSDADRVDYWLDSFDFNPDAKLGHVLAMVAHNEDLTFGSRDFSYDNFGLVQINRLNDIVKTAVVQDPTSFGANVEELTQRHLFEPLGMRSSSWADGAPDKPFAYGWYGTVRDMARLGLLILNGGVWNGERLLAQSWIEKMTHPAFEDANTGYGYLTWVHSRSNYASSASSERMQGPSDPCSPAAIWTQYPHGLSEAEDCGYAAPWTCAQEHDVGVWAVAGAGGQHIAGHPGLDMVLVSKYAGTDSSAFRTMWTAMRPALIALDPVFQDDEEAFCDAYGSNAYAPDLRR